MNPLPRVRAAEIGEFIRYNSCERRFKLGANGRELAKHLPFAGRLFRSIDPVLQFAGRQREEEWEKSLNVEECFVNLNNSSSERSATEPLEVEALEWKDFVDRCGQIAPGQSAYAREVYVAARIGAFEVEGRIDFLLLTWRDRNLKGASNSSNASDAVYPVLRLVECKASRKDRTYHRVQLSIYRMIIERLLSDSPLTIGPFKIDSPSIECVVARIDEATNTAQSILQLAPLDLSVVCLDTEKLLGVGGKLEQILRTNVDELPFKLEPKCDDCVFNVNCFPESARQRRLELLGCDPSTVRCLHRAGIKDLDALSELDLDGQDCEQILQSGNCSGHLDILTEKAAVRVSVLPEPKQYRYPVQLISVRTLSQLPPHCSKQAERLVRVYMSIDYDYSEHRIGALSAHVTASEGILETGWIPGGENQKSVPDPVLREKKLLRVEDNYKHIYDDERYDVIGEDIIHLRERPWSGSFERDAQDEQNMLETFFCDIVQAIQKQAGQRTRAAVHFYAWSRLEISRLVEACSRVSSTLPGHLRELLGCREPLEQMIYSCVQDEVNNRYGLAWTGRGLLVASSLSWFGNRYHWTRIVEGETVRLDTIFSQNLFDFCGTLHLDRFGRWAEENDPDTVAHKFEIRSRFNDSLPAPYWHAAWGTLVHPRTKGNTASTIIGFLKAGKPELLQEYLRARVHALRWIEERIDPKNPAILKIPVDLNQLPKFTLRVDNAARAAVDFLRLDHHIKVNDWIANQLIPPKLRITAGRTIPLRDVVPVGNNRVKAHINVTNYKMSISDLRACCTIVEGAFVRLSPCQDDPSKPQTINQLFRGGSTCVVKRIDWDQLEVELSVIPLANSDRYRLMSLTQRPYSEGYKFATLDESPSNFVDIRVDKRLCASKDSIVCSWFDRLNPTLPSIEPLADDLVKPLRVLLAKLDTGFGEGLAADQLEAVVQGMSSRVQLLQGPPGTGKTMTTAAALLVRVLAAAQQGDLIFVAANTHTAIDTLLSRVEALLPSVKEEAKKLNLEMPEIFLAKIQSSDDGSKQHSYTVLCADQNGIAELARQKSNHTCVVGGTTGSLLKMAEIADSFRARMLIIDEASMMVFPHFLALATLVHPGKGTFMLAGDHRQLAPIVAHDWEREDRPPAVLYQPYASAYDAIRHLSDSICDASKIVRSALQLTYRLPTQIRELIGKLYKLDNVSLSGPDSASHCETRDQEAAVDLFSKIWKTDTGLFLVVHDERESRQSNPLEVSIIDGLLSSALRMGVPPQSVAIITPHRAQRTLLQTRLAEFQHVVDIIDTVERLQGGERPTIIVSATVSDPAAIAGNVDFILDLNRSNVAFSRSKKRLIVVCSNELLDFIPAEIAQYEEAILWKNLRTLCKIECGQFQQDSYNIRFLSHS